jgi:hypothetical protein
MLGFFLFTATWSWAQHQVTSIQCDSIPFSEFITILEERTPMNVYYNPEWTDSMKVSLDVKDLGVRDILSMALKGTDLSFVFIDDLIILSKGYKIKTNYNQDVRNAYTSSGSIVRSESVEYLPMVRETEEIHIISPEFQLQRIGNPSMKNSDINAVISGYVIDGENGEPLVGAVVYFEAQNIGTASNAYGFYSIQIPKGQLILDYRFVGMKSTRRNIQLFSDGLLNVEMEEDIVSLKEVSVSAEGQQNVRSLSMGMERISINQIKNIPMALGEMDIIRSVTLLPGIQSVGLWKQNYYGNKLM